MVLTSPPYYGRRRGEKVRRLSITEVYKHMPRYESQHEFHAKFLFPVIRESYRHLQPGGTFVLNVPVSMIAEISTVLGPPKLALPLAMTARQHKDDVGGVYKEYMYVWKKPRARRAPPSHR